MNADRRRRLIAFVLSELGTLGAVELANMLTPDRASHKLIAMKHAARAEQLADELLRAVAGARDR